MTAVSIIIPAFDRVGPLRQTLLSAATALRALGKSAEILLVDDGSTVPLEKQLAGFNAGWHVSFLRQHNQGSIVARQAGLAAASGEWVLFLDSDDLVPPEKFVIQLRDSADLECDILYADMSRATLLDDGSVRFEPAEKLPATNDPAEFFLNIQPAPHNPLYRRTYLRRHLEKPLITPERRFDPAGDVWLYYNLCLHPAHIAKINAPLAAAGVHSENRYSLQWEKLAAAALPLMEAFASRCPCTSATFAARKILGERAFLTWRGLPRGFDRDFSQRMLTLWEQAPRSPLSRLGGKKFQLLARLLGPCRAGALLRLRNEPYRRVQTLGREQYRQLFPVQP